MAISRAGFTLSGAPVQKKMWGPSPRKNWRPFLVITVRRLSGVSSPEKLKTFFCWLLSGVAHYLVFRACKNSPLLLWGPPFCRGPCSAEHANMPKSAADNQTPITGSLRGDFTIAMWPTYGMYGVVCMCGACVAHIMLWLSYCLLRKQLEKIRP